MSRLIGEVVVVEWDENDEPVEIAIEVDGDQYLVAHNYQFEELVEHVGHEVEVEGLIEETGEEPVIRVHSFEVLELTTDDDEEAEEEDLSDDTF